MQCADLYVQLMSLLIDEAGFPGSLPLFGDFRTLIYSWAQNNPERAEYLIESLYQLLEQYRRSK